MKKLLGLFAVFVLFLAAIFAGLAIFPPTGLAHRLLVGGVRSATGLDLKIAGPMSLRLVPTVSLRMEDVTLASPSAADAPLAKAQSMEVNTSFRTALSGERRIERIALNGAKLDLTIGKDGMLEGLAPAPRRGVGTSEPPHISIGALELKDATIAYRDAQSGLDAQVTGVSGTVREARLDRFGEAVVKAGQISIRQSGALGMLDVDNLDVKVTEFEGGRIKEAQGNGSTVKWRDASQKSTLEASGFSATGRSIVLPQASAVALSLTSATASWRDGSGSSLQATGLTGSANSVTATTAGSSKLNAGTASWRNAAGDVVEIQSLAGEAASVGLDALGAATMKADQARWRSAGGNSIEVRGLDGKAKAVKPGRIEDLDVKGSRAAYSDGKRAASGSGALGLESASFATPLLAAGAPIEGKIGFAWNKEMIGGQVKLPAIEALSSATLPATLALTSARGTLDFDGAIDAAAGVAKGRVRANTSSVEQVTQWLAIPAPASLKGGLEIAGDVEAGDKVIRLANSRIAHGSNRIGGAIGIDFGGSRPRLSGRVSADKLDVEPYLGLAPVAAKPKPEASKPQIVEPEVNLADVFKSTMRAVLDAPPKRGGTLEIPDLPAEALIPATRRAKPQPGFTWSEEKLDFTALRDFDLDIDWSVKQLDVRGMQLEVPQLKTVLDAGKLALTGRDVGTKDGKITGSAEVDARENVPSISADLKGSGVELSTLSAAFGMTPVIEGNTAVEATLRSRGNSQKQLVEGLSGTVRTNMAQGNVLGYDLGNITLATLIRWITGNREYDPQRRTPVTGLKADLTIEKGVVRDSQVVMGGPLLGVNAEGTIGLVDQRIDYKGKARIASWFSGLPFKFFGAWARPTFQPDLGLANVFSRAPPGETTLTEIVAGADIKEDAELALLIGRVLQKAGPNGLDPGVAAALNALQGKALGRPQ